MTTIPSEKFEEWIETYTKGMSHCRTGQCGRDCPLYKEDNCETTLAQHLAFKSKEYIEAMCCCVRGSLKKDYKVVANTKEEAVKIAQEQAMQDYNEDERFGEDWEFSWSNDEPELDEFCYENGVKVAK